MTAVTAFAVQADEWGQPLRLHPDQAESKRTLDVQTDGAGHLWGIVSTKQGRRLARWCEDGWHTVILPTPREMEQDESTGLWIQIGREYGEEVERLLRLVPGPDGTVLASGVHCDFLLLRGDCARWIPRQFAKPDTWTLRMDRRGDAWLLSGDSEMYLVDASSDAEPVLTMAPDYGYLKRYGVRNWSVPDIAVKLVDDGRHRFWALNEVAPWGVGGTYRQVPLVFWPGFDAAQDLTPGDDAPPIFLLDGRHGYWASRGRVLGRRKTPEEIQFIARKDTNTLWFSSDPCGLIELDSATLKVKRPKIQGPAPRYIMHSVFQVGERWYGVCREKPKAPPGPAVLCRFDGVSWHALPLTLDPHDGPHLGIDRPRLATDSGVWLGSGGPAIAFIPRDGTDPVLYDWRYGFRMPRATSIAQTPDGRLLIAHKSEPDTLLSESDLFALETSAQTVNCWWKVGDLLQTADGFIWHASRGGDWKSVLRRLEGSDGRSVDSEYSDCCGVCGDRKNRLWVT
ncbi:MAG: hypothetical protein GY851_11445, partial [bacterium]|nr:hypothetical protein [bacterium]